MFLCHVACYDRFMQMMIYCLMHCVTFGDDANQIWKNWRWSTYCDIFVYDCVEQKIDWNASHMQCSDMVSLQCGSSRVFSDVMTDWISCDSVNTCTVSLQCGSSHVFSDVMTDWISCDSVNTCTVSLQCGSSHAVLNDPDPLRGLRWFWGSNPTGVRTGHPQSPLNAVQPRSTAGRHHVPLQTYHTGGLQISWKWTLFGRDPRPAYLLFVHFPYALACGPPSRLPAVRPFPIRFGNAVPHPAYLLFVHFPYALACGPLSRLPAIRPFPIHFGMRTPVPLTCHLSISHPGQHVDHYMATPRPTNLLFVRLPTKVTKWPLDHCWPIHGHAPVPQTYYLFAYLLKWQWSLDHCWPLPRPPVPRTYYLSAYLLKWQNDHCPALGPPLSHEPTICPLSY